MAALKVGVIGAGWFGEIHCNVIAGAPGLELAALAEQDPARREEIGRQYNVPALYTDYHGILADPAIDLVHIVTRWENHAEIATAALAAGKHVLLEKPMAPTLAECEQICRAARQAKTYLMVGHVCRFNPRCIAAQKEISAGSIGRVVSLNGRRNLPAAWAEDVLNKVNPITDTAVHDTDLMLWFTGAPVTSVYTQTVRVNDYLHPDLFQIMYRFENGATAIYESAWLVPDAAPWLIDERMSIMGSEGFVQVQDTFPNLGVCTATGFTGPDTTYWPRVDGVTGGALRDEIMYFANCVAIGKRPSVITPEDSMAAMKTVLAAQESAESGEIVVLD
ncbi:MAG: Gfo/Idh/MocA family oxidoreductase [Proteobacteria bacterium]|nr:Gfo/Idh/MocA family oxidoreductase [Pseudomonadota bacterium]MDA1357063.1 Gfo/Idh/MocA family oxidoreductase [Pseudomonadota bacterium]